MKNRLALLITLGLTCFGCKTFQKVSRPLTISDVDRAQIEIDDQASIITKFGAPETKISSKDRDIEYWIYIDPPFKTARLSLGFFSTSKKLNSKLWVVRENDPEQNIETATQRFRDANFIKTEAPWTNPHMEPEEELMVDQNKGLTIEIRKSWVTKQDEVTGIYWRSNRKIHTATVGSN